MERALRRAQNGAREDSIENGAQDLLRRSLPEGTAFSSDSTSSSGPSQELPSVRTFVQPPHFASELCTSVANTYYHP